MGRHIVAVGMKFQIVRARQIGDEFLIRVRLCPAQLVIEMNDGEDNPQFLPQLQQQPQKCNGINPAGNGYTNAIPRLQQFLPLNVIEHALCQ